MCDSAGGAPALLVVAGRGERVEVKCRRQRFDGLGPVASRSAMRDACGDRSSPASSECRGRRWFALMFTQQGEESRLMRTGAEQWLRLSAANWTGDASGAQPAKQRNVSDMRRPGRVVLTISCVQARLTPQGITMTRPQEVKRSCRSKPRYCRSRKVRWEP